MEPAAGFALSEDEYLECERCAATKHEWVNGEVAAMAGGSPSHNAIASNVVAALRVLTRGRRRVPFNSDQRIHIPDAGMYTYADALVACGPQFHPKNPDSLVNPVVVIEVLSDSTEAYDRGAKFAHYRHIPSLQAYMLISQNERRVDLFRRIEPDQWLLTEHVGDAAVPLPMLGGELQTADIYEDLVLLDARLG